jgi:preprotein translocase subunit YajC
MHWNVILADASAPAHSTPAAPSAQDGSTTTTVAQPGKPAQPATPFGGGINLLFPLVLIVLIMYFMSIRPQQQRTKQLAKLLASVKSGDKVVTSSGIVGVVISVKDKTVSLRSADTKMEVTKASISEIVQNDDTQTSP